MKFPTTIACWLLLVCIAPHPVFAEGGSAEAVGQLRQHLDISPDQRPRLDQQRFASAQLTKEDVVIARSLLAKDRLARIRAERGDEMEAKRISYGTKDMPLFFKRFGEKPDSGWSLYISMHGGGGTAPRVNDSQWENQKRLYRLEEGIYVAPRAPTDTWNLWHQSHIDPLFDRLIENMVAFEDVDWNRVYIMGYSAGGDGVYQLAPRMADRLAAAAMMAGHPNETSPLGLRNVPFALQVGGRDSAYKRNTIAADWQKKLATLREKDPGGYEHFVKIYPKKGHWMDREDAVAISWMSKHTRNPTPGRIVWKQDDVTHPQLYWLGVNEKNEKARTEITAEVQGQTIHLSATDVSEVSVFLDDRFIDLDQSVRIESQGQVLFDDKVDRTIGTLFEMIETRGDPNLSFPSQVSVKLR